MTYCHVSTQIAEHAHNVDDDVTCDVCKSDNVEVDDLGQFWYKHCQDCGWEENNEIDYGD